MKCSTCGAEIDHTCAEGALIGSLVTSCAVQKGALWVRVTAGGADVKGAGVARRKVGEQETEEHFTEETGCTGFNPLDAGDYQIALVSMPAELEPSFGLPIPAEKAAPVTQGKLTFRELALVPRVRPLIALAVEGEKRTLTLRAEPDFDGKGKGVLTVLKGAESIKLKHNTNTLPLADRKVEFPSVPFVGIVVEVEALDGGEPKDVELEWKLSSETTPVAKDAVKAVLTGFHPQGIAVVYDMSQYSRDRKDLVFDLNMGKLCISKTGQTSIYSGAFAGCLGLIISPTVGSGGMVSHILQGGGKGSTLGNPAYLMEAASTAIDMAYDLWGQLDIVLFRGVAHEKTGAIEFPEMANRLRANYDPRKIRTINDQRHNRSSDALFFETKNRKLYLFKGFPPDFDAYCDDVDDSMPLLKESLVKSSLALATKKSPMDQFTVK